MALQSGLYKSQDQQEQDLTSGPGWTTDDQKPTTFGGILGAIPRGIGQGGAEALAALAHGSAKIGEGAREASLSEAGLADEPPAPEENPADETERKAREYSKSLVGDPRTTGTAANVIQGFSKAATEFTLGSVVGGPASGAALLGASEGYAHYNDLLDQGVDEDTARRSGLTTALLTGGSAFLPMAMPAKWLAGLSTPAVLAAQAATGAAVNTGFGAVNRYADAKILRDAGYDSMADQQEVWDKANVLTDAISGAFFGAHIGWHGIKALDGAKIDHSVLDAAKVVQDRRAVLDAAPGVPVDAKSQAVHREALSTSLEQLLTEKPVDLSEIDTAGATFARGEVDQSAATKIIRDAFVKSGVLDEHEFNDSLDFLNGEKEEPTSQKPAEAAESVKPEPAEEGAAYDVGEQEEMTDEQRELFQGLRSEPEPGVRSELHAEQEPGAARRAEPAESVPGRSDGRAARGTERAAGGIGEPLAVHRGSTEPLSPRDFEPESFGHATERPSAGLGVFFTNDKAEAAGYGKVTTHHLDIRNPLHIRAEDVPGFDSIQDATKWREKQRAKGHDGLIIDASHMGGQTWYVPFEHSQVRPAAKAPIKTTGALLADRPDLEIADEHGAPASAADALKSATAEEAQANKEADPMHEAAVACEARHA